MANVSPITARRTSADDVFDYLHEEINSLRLRPGDKISEAEIAAQFGVSRQPVRDAFTRLQNLDLLLIRPQRATEVKRFSLHEIEKSRFVRAAVEAEVLRRAARIPAPDADLSVLDRSIEDQETALQNNEFARFGLLDYEFHKALCHIAGVDMAFEVISFEKAKCDRLCVLGLEKESRMPQLIEDHRDIARCIREGDEQGAVDAGMLHLTRLDATIEKIFAENANYFVPETD